MISSNSRDDLSSSASKPTPNLVDPRLLDRRGFLGGAATVAAALGVGALAGAPVASAAGRARRAPVATKQTISAAVSTLQTVLDPNSSVSGGAMPAWLLAYETLVDGTNPPDLASAKRSTQLKRGPLLAQSWTSIGTGRQWRFTLRPNARSGYGNLLTAEDVVWSFRRALSVRGLTTSFLNASGITEPGQIKARNARTVEFLFASTPPPFWVGLLGTPYMPIFDSKEATRHATASDPWANAWLSQNVAGFGPYRLLERAADGSRTVMEANPGYWGKGTRTIVPQQIFTYIPEDSNRLQLVLSGAVDISDRLSALQLDEVKKSSIANVVQVATSGMMFLGVDSRKSPANTPQLRQAMAQAIPYDQILRTVYRGYATRWRSFVPAYYEAISEKLWKWNTNAEAAKRGLASVAGAPFKISYEAGDTTQEQIAIQVAEALTRAGLDATPDGGPQPVVRLKRLGGELPAWLDPYDSGSVADTFYRFRELNTAGTAINNIIHFPPNAQVAAAYEAGVKAKNVKAREKALLESQRLLVNDMPFIPIAYTGHYFAASKKLTGFRSITLNILATRQLRYTS